MTKDTPALAYIEHQILALATRSGSSRAAARDVEAAYGLSAEFLGTGIFKAARVLALLYCLVLGPKESTNLTAVTLSFGRSESSGRWRVSRPSRLRTTSSTQATD